MLGNHLPLFLAGFWWSLRWILAGKWGCLSAHQPSLVFIEDRAEGLGGKPSLLAVREVSAWEWEAALQVLNYLARSPMGKPASNIQCGFYKGVNVTLFCWNVRCDAWQMLSWASLTCSVCTCHMLYSHRVALNNTMWSPLELQTRTRPLINPIQISMLAFTPAQSPFLLALKYPIVLHVIYMRNSCFRVNCGVSSIERDRQIY